MRAVGRVPSCEGGLEQSGGVVFVGRGHTARPGSGAKFPGVAPLPRALSSIVRPHNASHSTLPPLSTPPPPASTPAPCTTWQCHPRHPVPLGAARLASPRSRPYERLVAGGERGWRRCRPRSRLVVFCAGKSLPGLYLYLFIFVPEGSLSWGVLSLYVGIADSALLLEFRQA